MKKLLLAAAVTLAASTAHAARVVECSTAGDALGGLSVYFETTTRVAIKESAMSGKTFVYRANVTADDWRAFSAGRDVSFVWYPADAPMFGGAVSKASILTLHARPSTAAGAPSRGFLSRGGTVFFLNCKN